MKPRKLMIVIEALTDIPAREFSKNNVQVTFDDNFVIDDEEIFTIHQVRTQVVKENK